MKEIQLTKGQIALISDCDFERVMEHSWCMHPAGYAKARINTKYVLMHRWIMGAKDGEEMDHINGNKLDNRRENLRFCNSTQNHANRGVFASSKSGFKGVTWNRYHRKYRARIMLNRKDIFLGYFDDPVEAARIYDKSAIKIFGEFAYLNFPQEIPCLNQPTS